MTHQPSTLRPRILVSWVLVFISVLEILGWITAPPRRSSCCHDRPGFPFFLRPRRGG
jgi:hypothetical protein